MNIIKSSTPNKSSRQGYKPELIVCHITDGAYNGAVSWLRNPASQVSAHFVVSQKGEITQLVDITEKAWCNGGISNPTSEIVKAYTEKGDINPNLYTISIEHEGIWKNTKGALTTEQEKATTELIRWIISEVKRLYGTSIPADRKHIIGHCEINRTSRPNCPGRLFPFDRIIGTLNASTSVKILEVGKKVQLNKAALYINSYGGIAVRYLTGTYTVSRLIQGRSAGVLINTNLGWVRSKDCIVL